MPPRNKQTYLRLITDLLDELDQEDDLGRGSQAVGALDQQSVGRLSRMESLQAQAMARAAQTRRDSLCTELQAERNRLDDDSFGVCHDYGENIAPKRLAFNPAVRLCQSCASG